jgi:alpha-beta hydrolase superfamily lysophospholipase
VGYCPLLSREDAVPSESVVVDEDGIEIHLTRWDPLGPPRAVVHILHGRAEHARRYARLADALTRADCAVYADDHRGHGRTGLAAGGLGVMGPGGDDGLLTGVRAVSRLIAEEHPDGPVVLLGHSWGSFIAQRYLPRWGGELAGVVLTGTTDREHRRSMDGGPNAAFPDARTPYDWLSRDELEVDAYIADPWCGFESVPDRGADDRPTVAVHPQASRANIPAGLSVLILNGGADPIGGGEGGRMLAERYRSMGLTDVELRIYPDARHELFNELNREEVTSDLLAWLHRVVGA